MNVRQRLGVTLGAVGLAVAAAAVPGTAASAAVDDSFIVFTGEGPGGCANYGMASYIDHGDVFGDDYAGVYDACKDGVGVEAWVWIDDTVVAHQRNGTGFNTEIYFDIPNVTTGHKVAVEVCAQNGADGAAFACGYGYTHSKDG